MSGLGRDIQHLQCLIKKTRGNIHTHCHVESVSVTIHPPTGDRDGDGDKESKTRLFVVLITSTYR